ncbi:(Fe-S)-binding protein [bacterium]|nr:(Fe-S)-binding protein [bacterium]
MPDARDKPVDTKKVKALLKRKKARMKLSLAACAGCSLCADSCFLFKSKGRDPRYMPSYKVLQTLGKLYRKRGKVSRAELEQMKELLWKNCALCERCYCPLGIDLPNMIAFARGILRSQGVYGVYPHSLGAPEQGGNGSGDQKGPSSKKRDDS